MEREEPERQQTNTTTAEAYLDALWTYILGLVRAGVEEPQDRPNAICSYHVENEHMALFWRYRDRDDSRCVPKQTWMA